MRTVPKKQPLVSIIIPTHNRSKLLNRALASVFQQTYKNYEVIVVDDGSTDQTIHQLEHRPHLTLIHKEKQGVSKARNTGLQHAKGELITFLDSDDEWNPEKLERQVEFFDKNPDVMIAQTDEIWIRNGRRVNPMKKHRKVGGRIFKECLPLCIVSPSAVMMRKELFDEIGTFDESFPACEDYDLWLRIASRYPIHLIEEKLVVKYGGHAGQLSHTIENLDQYRIQALVKILKSGCLNKENSKLAYQELQKKCKIYGDGCLKRGKTEEGQKYLELPNMVITVGA